MHCGKINRFIDTGSHHLIAVVTILVPLKRNAVHCYNSNNTFRYSDCNLELVIEYTEFFLYSLLILCKIPNFNSLIFNDHGFVVAIV